MESDWFVLRLFPRQEDFVCTALTEKGFSAYLPKTQTFARHARRKAVRTRPLIPGYLFARLPDADAMVEAFAIRGVLGVISNGGRPQPIPAEAVGALALAEAWRKFDHTWRPPAPIGAKRRYSHRWRPGEEVEIVQGPAQGWSGVISRTHGRNRLEVLLGHCQVVVDQRDVVSLGEAVSRKAA